MNEPATWEARQRLAYEVPAKFRKYQASATQRIAVKFGRQEVLNRAIGYVRATDGRLAITEKRERHDRESPGGKYSLNLPECEQRIVDVLENVERKNYVLRTGFE